MSFPRDEAPPRIVHLVGSALATLVGNVLLFGAALVVAFSVDQRSPVGDAVVFVVTFAALAHGLLQWLYVVPICLASRHRRGLFQGVLLGAVVYTVGHLGLMSFVTVFLVGWPTRP